MSRGEEERGKKRDGEEETEHTNIGESMRLLDRLFWDDDDIIIPPIGPPPSSPSPAPGASRPSIKSVKRL